MGTDANSADEWVELFNAGNTTANLDGWSLFEDETKIITLSGVIYPGAYYLIERTDDKTVSDVPASTYGPFSGSGLKNLPGGENLTLHNDQGMIVDSVLCSGGWFAGSNSPKASMERKGAELPGSDPASWASNDGVTKNGNDANNIPINGTPGSRNSQEI
jgi:hypothetical protein